MSCSELLNQPVYLRCPAWFFTSAWIHFWAHGEKTDQAEILRSLLWVLAGRIFLNVHFLTLRFTNILLSVRNEYTKIRFCIRAYIDIKIAIFILYPTSTMTPISARGPKGWFGSKLDMVYDIITKTRLFKYIENFTTQKWKKKQTKILIFFHTSAQNIDCGYSLEPPWRGGSNEYPQFMFWAEIRKIMDTPVNPSFTI